MCGVFAALAWRGALEDARPRLERALDAMAFRGPDGRGIWEGDGGIAIGHVRLAVRDVAGGAQPIANEDGAIVAAVNGELYGVASLRAELESLGHRFRTKGDSEIVVHAWEEWGRAMLGRLRGELAFVLWDARDRTLFAARDRFGTKPLAWTDDGDEVLVASNARALFAMGIAPAWDHAALFQCASLQYAPPDATLFAGVHQLPAGHALLARDGRVRVFPYWDLDYPAAPEAPRSLGTAVTQFRARFDEAVRERLEAEVPIAFQLSGGLDSSAVLASAARVSSGPLDAFTIGFAGEDRYDESSLAAETAAHLGARHYVLRVSDRELADALPEAIAHAEGACINAHASAKLVLSRAIRDAGFKVVLTGEGADEVLFGYAHLRSDLEGSAARVTASNSASAGLMLPDGDGIPTGAIERALGFVPTWIAAKAAFGKRLRALARDEWLVPYATRDACRVMLSGVDVDGQLRGRGRVEQSAYLWSKLALEGYILRALGDGLEMASSVEGRLPMLDVALFELLRALPLDLKIRGGVEKWILREAMRDRLPERLLAREKHPFLAPPMGPRMLGVARDLIASQAFRASSIFDSCKVQAILDALPTLPSAERKALDPVLFFVMSTAILQARFGVTS